MPALLRRVLLPVAIAALAPGTAAAALNPDLPIGRYTGQTGDGHVFQFSVERSPRPNHPRKITHFYLVYDIANCRSGPIRQPFFAKVYYGSIAAQRGAFARDIAVASGQDNTPQLSLTGRFTSKTKATGSFKVGVRGKCPITDQTPKLRFSVTRTSTAASAATAPQRPRAEATAACEHQSTAGFPTAYTSAANLRAGPLTLVGAAAATTAADVRRFGGMKYPALVRPGHRVTVAVRTPGARLQYGFNGTHKVLTFAACDAGQARSRAGGAPVTFWSGFLRTAPRCVRLDVWVDDARTPLRRRIAVGRSC